MSSAIIAIAKNEQLYIDEWVNHHLSLGFNNIIIADNDDEFILPGIVTDPRVKHENYCGIDKVQSLAYTQLYDKYRKDYDWLLFIDVDEFVMLDEHYASVAEFLEGFDCDVVRLSCLHYSDGDMLDADGDYSVLSRFKEQYRTNLDTFCKSIINTRVDRQERQIYGHGIYDKSLDARNALNDPCECFNQHTNRIVDRVAWINHYPTKTIGEYIKQKYNRGGANGNHGRYSKWEQYFFRTNRKTQEKIDYANKLINELKK